MFSFPPCCWAQDTSLYSNMRDPISPESEEWMDITKRTLTWTGQGRTTPSAPVGHCAPQEGLERDFQGNPPWKHCCKSRWPHTRGTVQREWEKHVLPLLLQAPEASGALIKLCTKNSFFQSFLISPQHYWDNSAGNKVHKLLGAAPPGKQHLLPR